MASYKETDETKKQEYEKQLQQIEEDINVRMKCVFNVVLYPLS